MYCLSCFYDLRGLPEHRCPECGRWFDPARPGSYSPAPCPQRLQKFLDRVEIALDKLISAPAPQAAKRSPSSFLLNRLVEVGQEVAELRALVALLVERLEQTGNLHNGELDELRRRAKEMAESIQFLIEDDRESGGHDSSPELIQIQKAAASVRAPG